MTPYTLSVHVDTDVETAESRIREALAEQGFGVLTEIDLQATLREKLGAELPPYKILGACRPPLALQALEADADIGALLPCNVVIRSAADGGTEIVAVDPQAMLAVSPAADALAPVAADARKRIESALAAAAS